MREVNATVLENTQIAEGVFSLSFACDEEIRPRAGQFAMIGVHGFPLRRPIAICKSEGERITVCYRVKGEGTRRLSLDYKNGEKLSVLLPLGNGFSLTEEEKNVVLVGGGAGIFPLISAIRQWEGKKKLTAFMGFRDKRGICMEYEMQRAGELVLATADGSCGFHGTSVEAFSERAEEIRPDVILACGPVPMLRALKEAAGGVPVYASLEERMGCGAGACLVCVCNLTNGAHARVCKDGPVFALSEIAL